MIDPRGSTENSRFSVAQDAWIVVSQTQIHERQETGKSADCDVSHLGTLSAASEVAMRRLPATFLAKLVCSSILIACLAKSEDDAESADANLTETELATKALKIMGAPQIPRQPNDPPSCNFIGCHSINPVTV